MKISVAIVALVVVVGMAECSPKLQAKLETLKARAAAASSGKAKTVESDKRSWENGYGYENGFENGFGNGWGYFRYPEGNMMRMGEHGMLTNTIRAEWPYAWLELVSFVGKCMSARNYFDLMEYRPEEGILVHICPQVISEMEHYEMEKMSDAQLMEETMRLRRYFELFQCVNLQAERETLYFWSGMNESEDASMFEREAQPLFSACLHTFNSYAQMDREFEEGVEQATENNMMVYNTLRELITYAKTR